MASTFEDSLKATADRLKAEQQTAADEKAKRVEIQTALVAHVQEAIKDWNSRIAPSLIQAVAKANDITGSVGIQLVHEIIGVQVLRAPRDGPALPYLPGIRISRKIPDHVQRALQTGRKPGAPARRLTLPNSTTLDIGINENGEVVTTAQRYKTGVDVRRPIPAAQFAENEIESAVNEFIHAGLLGNVPPPANGADAQIVDTRNNSPAPRSQSDLGFSQHGTSTFDTAGAQIAVSQRNLSAAVLSTSGVMQSVLPPQQIRDAGEANSRGQLPEARVTIARAMEQNHLSIECLAISFLALIDDKIVSIRSALPNSDDGRTAQQEELADYENLRKRVESFLAAAKQLSIDEEKKIIAIDATISLEQGIKKWWTEGHVRICERTFDFGLFSLATSVCLLAGSGGELATIVSGILVKGKPVADAIAAWVKK